MRANSNRDNTDADSQLAQDLPAARRGVVSLVYGSGMEAGPCVRFLGPPPSSVNRQLRALGMRAVRLPVYHDYGMLVEGRFHLEWQVTEPRHFETARAWLRANLAATPNDDT